MLTLPVIGPEIGGIVGVDVIIGVGSEPSSVGGTTVVAPAIGLAFSVSAMAVWIFSSLVNSGADDPHPVTIVTITRDKTKWESFILHLPLSLILDIF